MSSQVRDTSMTRPHCKPVDRMLQQTLVLFTSLQDLLVPSESLEGACWMGMDEARAVRSTQAWEPCLPSLDAGEGSSIGCRREMKLVYRGLQNRGLRAGSHPDAP